MGLITHTGRNLLSNLVIQRSQLWGVFGRPDYSSGSPSSYPWDDENSPPSEDVLIPYPDDDIGSGIVGIGYKLFKHMYTVIPDDNGDLIVNNQGWRIAADSSTTPYLYVSFELNEFDFNSIIGGVGSLISYRRFTIVYGVTPPPNVSDTFRYGQFDYQTFIPGTSYVANTLVVPTISNGFIYRVVTGGDANDEPRWPTLDNVSVSSGGVTFMKHSDKVSIEDRRGVSFYTKNFTKADVINNESLSPYTEKQLIELILLP